MASSGGRRCRSEPLLGELELLVDGASDASLKGPDGVTGAVRAVGSSATIRT
jgi:hypothetical protein